LNYRTHLWRIGAAVLGHELFPAKPLPLKRSAVLAPYTDEDVTELVSWARGLPTSHMRRNTRALLAIGLGAGLSSEEIQRLVGTDIRQVGGRISVEVIGKAPRTVPVTAEWADDVWTMAHESGGSPYFAPERNRITRRDVLGFIERSSGDDGAQFNVQRLRVTWIVHHLSVGTHLIEFQKMAGVSAGQLVKYLKFATSPGTISAPGEEIRQPGFADQLLHTN
jgi:site-specific recombinase XerC